MFGRWSVLRPSVWLARWAANRYSGQPSCRRRVPSTVSSMIQNPVYSALADLRLWASLCELTTDIGIGLRCHYAETAFCCTTTKWFRYLLYSCSTCCPLDETWPHIRETCIQGSAPVDVGLLLPSPPRASCGNVILEIVRRRLKGKQYGSALLEGAATALIALAVGRPRPSATRPSL